MPYLIPENFDPETKTWRYMSGDSMIVTDGNEYWEEEKITDEEE